VYPFEDIPAQRAFGFTDRVFAVEKLAVKVRLVNRVMVTEG
jgi:hypothetical protein